MQYKGEYLPNAKLVDFSALVGKTIAAIEKDNFDGDQLTIACSDGSAYVMLHQQDCCEHVEIEDICGDLEDLIGNPVLQAEESTSEGDKSRHDSSTWTFYKLATIKGSVTIRWFGESNGYYSEGVDFYQIKFARAYDSAF